jgi:hypothetical protein
MAARRKYTTQAENAIRKRRDAADRAALRALRKARAHRITEAREYLNQAELNAIGGYESYVKRGLDGASATINQARAIHDLWEEQYE